MLHAYQVKNEVDRIRKVAGDDEQAHEREDDLYEVVLNAIANNDCSNPQECAKVALKTKDIMFARWCA